MVSKNIAIDRRLLDKYLPEVKSYRTWQLGNDCLYSLCEKHPYHNKVDEVVAKLWLIGRSYAAALERRKNKRENEKEFYEFKAAPTVMRSDLDNRLKRLSKHSSVSEINLKEIVQVHGYLTTLFYKLTEQYKGSLASKYLHFHLPGLFFLKDTRAQIGLSRLAKGMRVSIEFQDDYWYGHFSAKLINVRHYIKNEMGISLTPREIDTMLLMIADKE